MKFITVTVSAVFIFASAYASFIDDSTVNDECDTGCKSRLSLSVSATGAAKDEILARNLCKEDCSISNEEASQLCNPLCGIFTGLRDTQDFNQPETCALCNANPGAGIGACMAAVESVQTTCMQVCDFGTPVNFGGNINIFGSATITQDFPGAGCN